MEWDKKLEKFVVSSPTMAPLMNVRVKVMSQIEAQFVGRKVGLWGQLKNARSTKECSLKDTGAMICVCGMSTVLSMGLGANVLAKTRMVLMGVKRTRLTVLGALAVEISAGDKTSYQIVYVTKETKWLLLSKTFLEQLACHKREMGR